MCVPPTYLSVCHVHISGLQRTEEGVGCPGTKLQTIVSLHIDAGIKCGSSGREARAISPAPLLNIQAFRKHIGEKYTKISEQLRDEYAKF